MQRPIQKPAGTSAAELDTPSLLVDLEQLEANLAARADPMRAEAWVHGTPAIAQRQLTQAGVVGIAVRSVGEAEAFAAAGIDDIRILRPAVLPATRRRVAALAKTIRVVTGDDGLPLGGADALRSAVTVSARVTSVPEPGRAIHDCGQKAIGRDFGDPHVAGREELTASAGSAEHGMVLFDGNVETFAIGDWLQLVPADIATVFALHDFAYAVRGGRLDAVWPISARGAFA